jgi:hypothetical protein
LYATIYTPGHFLAIFIINGLNYLVNDSGIDKCKLLPALVGRPKRNTTDDYYNISFTVAVYIKIQ